jgi:hypothetical protein
MYRFGIYFGACMLVIWGRGQMGEPKTPEFHCASCGSAELGQIGEVRVIYKGNDGATLRSIFVPGKVTTEWYAAAVEWPNQVETTVRCFACDALTSFFMSVSEGRLYAIAGPRVESEVVDPNTGEPIPRPSN